jgi:transposase
MRFVPAKTAEQQAALMLVGICDRLIRNQTKLTNAIRGFAAEFGVTVPRGQRCFNELLERLRSAIDLPELASVLFAIHAKE